MTPEAIADYIANFEFELSAASLAGLEEFRALDTSLGRRGNAA
jgi:hypothetical protein